MTGYNMNVTIVLLIIEVPDLQQRQKLSLPLRPSKFGNSSE